MSTFFGGAYTPTKTVLFTDAVDTGCGQATSQTGPFYCPVDQLVYIDLGFMQALEQQLIGKPTDLAEQYIIAHEYGHHIQNLVGINQQVQQAQQNDPGRANQYSVAMELQADCYAGMWVGDVASRGLLDSADEINEALNAAAGVGDDRIQEKMQGRIDKEAWTHGSAEQRQTWFTRGYNSGDPNQCDTFSDL
jgi:predicted metalloprotease